MLGKIDNALSAAQDSIGRLLTVGNSTVQGNNTIGSQSVYEFASQVWSELEAIRRRINKRS